MFHRYCLLLSASVSDFLEFDSRAISMFHRSVTGVQHASPQIKVILAVTCGSCHWFSSRSFSGHSS